MIRIVTIDTDYINGHESQEIHKRNGIRQNNLFLYAICLFNLVPGTHIFPIHSCSRYTQYLERPSFFA